MCFSIKNNGKPEVLEIFKEDTIGLRRSPLYAIYHRLFKYPLVTRLEKALFVPFWKLLLLPSIHVILVIL